MKTAPTTAHAVLDRLEEATFSAPAHVTAELELIAAAIAGYRFSTSTELAMQTGVQAALVDQRYSFEREVRLDERSRIDFLVGAVGVELKIDGSLMALIRQLQRYAAFERIGALLVVTTRSKHLGAHGELGGKPVRVLHLSGGL